MRIAVYGGSFNPPHLGHIEAAKSVVQALAPDRFLIVPAAVPPHKALAEDKRKTFDLPTNAVKVDPLR